jgi:hypothetical protein
LCWWTKLALALLDNLALDIAQIANHPVIVKRGALQQIDHPGIGPIALPKSPFRMSATPAAIRDRTTKRSWAGICAIRRRESRS